MLNQIEAQIDMPLLGLTKKRFFSKAFQFLCFAKTFPVGFLLSGELFHWMLSW